MDQQQAQAPTKGFLFPLSNGSTKKPHRPPPPPPENQLYRECLKNHAASLGGHALDGCGEFMPSPAATPTDPTSLKCAACGCHRNFHRRAAVSSASGGEELEGEGEDDGRRRSSSSPPPPPSYFTSAPHTLLALSRDGRPVGSPAAAVTVPRKRFRSKFSAEQKGRMLELSERLGWRMQRRDEGVVAEYCKAIGVGIGVFKIWMHNNKYHLFGCRRGGGDGGGGTQLFQGGMRSNVFNVAGELGGGGGGGGGGVKVEGNGSGVDSGEADGNGLNGSSSSS